jgi:hypothetical protein
METIEPVSAEASGRKADEARPVQTNAAIDPLQCWRTPSAMLAHIYKHYLKSANWH